MTPAGLSVGAFRSMPPERHICIDAPTFAAFLRRDIHDRRATSCAGHAFVRVGTLTAVLGQSAAAARFAALLASCSNEEPLVAAGRIDGLDEGSRARALDWLRRRARTRPVILTTSERSVASGAHRVIVVIGDTPVADGPPDAVLHEGTLGLLERSR
jgi:hypothetical protein